MLSMMYLMPMTQNENDTASLIFEILRLQGKLTTAGEQLVGPLGLTPARWQILGSIANAPMTMADIARFLGNARQSVRRIVCELEAESLVELRENPRHKRAPLIALTPEGTKIYALANQRRLPWNARLAVELDDGEAAQALRTLQKLSVLLK